MKTDLEYMKRAMMLAMKGKGKTSPNPAVGAVIVRKDTTVGEGWHRRCGAPHAEAVALKKAGVRAKGAKMYVTLEPCAHTGRTLPCVDSILRSGIREVIVGMKDPNPKTNGRSLNKLRRAGVRVRLVADRDFQKAIERMNEDFVTRAVKKRPMVIAKTAQTLDGKIATASGDSKWITSSEARTFASGLRSSFDAILVGVETVLKDDPGLNAPGKKLKKIILDSRLRIPIDAGIFKNTLPADCWIVTTDKANRRKLRTLQRRGVGVIAAPAKKGRVDLDWLLKELAHREINSLLIEGGSRVIGQALKQGLVDKMMIYVAPKILGDQAARSAVDGLRPRRVDEALRLRDIEIHTFKTDFLIEGYVS